MNEHMGEGYSLVFEQVQQYLLAFIYTVYFCYKINNIYKNIEQLGFRGWGV